jgi:UDP-N-acetylmuramate: L-alanyl-gamma-D-glutamyl-meso-diaminopimelate ligase
MKVHFIAIGGSAMHNLAIALKQKGFTVTGSDDEIFNPSLTRLQKHGLLPERYGWFPERLDNMPDAVIVGMHAKSDNPELLRAQELGLNIFSYPEFLYQQSKNKTRIVIGGSHGKTTITSMILHVLKYHHIDVDFMVGAQLEGFEVMVKLSEKAPFMVMEGDEYPSSPTNLRPKFHLYKPHIAVISGIAWDHINVFKTFDDYLDQFRKFIHCVEENGKLIYCAADDQVKALCETEAGQSLTLFPYELPAYRINDDATRVMHDNNSYPVSLFGKHNLLNMQAARFVTMQLGVSSEMFFEAIQKFKGASKRMELVYEDDNIVVIRDFAHAPSKLRATVEAVREKYQDKHLVACMELHTYSSLSEHFLSEYAGSMDAADEALVFFNPRALALKKLPDLDPGKVAESFEKPGIHVYNDSEKLKNALHSIESGNLCLLMMSSGNFGGIDLKELVKHHVFI